jgi:hypothetical protein
MFRPLFPFPFNGVYIMMSIQVDPRDRSDFDNDDAWYLLRTALTVHLVVGKYISKRDGFMTYTASGTEDAFIPRHYVGAADRVE